MTKSTGKSISNISTFKLPEADVESDENILFFRKKLKEQKVDIIWLHSPYISFHNLCVKAKKDIPLVHSIHCDPLNSILGSTDSIDRFLFNKTPSDIFSLMFYLLKRPLSKIVRERHLSHKFNKIYNEADAITVLAEKHITDIKGIAKLNDTSKLYRFSNPLNIIDLNPLVLENKKKEIVFVGRLDWQKRLDRLLYIWAIAQKTLSDWNFIVIGEGDEKLRLEELAKKLNLKNIHFKGYKPSIDYLKKASILCMSSSVEGFGMVLIEAQKYGCIPFSFDSFSAVNDIIENNVSGILIKPFDLNEYAQKLIELCNDEPRREYISRNGIQSIHKFDSNNIIKEWILLFENLISIKRDNKI